MMFLSHFLFGILLGFASCRFLSSCTDPLLFVLAAAFFSSVPDIDHVSSKIGRRLPPFAVVSQMLFRHRGFIHSIFPALLIFYLLNKVSPLLAAAALIGYFSHLLLDATTRKGVRPFYPLSKWKVSGIIVTNGFLEKIVLVMLLVMVFALIASNFLVR